MKKTKPKETKTCKQCHNTYDISAFNNPVTKICMGCVRQAEAHNPAPKTIEDIKKMPHSTDQVLHIVEPPKCEHEEWEKEFEKEFPLIPNAFGCHLIKTGRTSLAINREEVKKIKSFISSEIEKAYEQGKNERRLDVSSWKNMGEKCGYFKFFEEKARQEEREECKKILNSGRKMFELGRQEERERLLEWLNKNGCNCSDVLQLLKK